VYGLSNGWFPYEYCFVFPIYLRRSVIHGILLDIAPVHIIKDSNAFIGSWQFLFSLLFCAIIPARLHLQREHRGIILCSYIIVYYANSLPSITRQAMHVLT
jgi:hypothetical protein